MKKIYQYFYRYFFYHFNQLKAEMKYGCFWCINMFDASGTETEGGKKW